MTKFILNIFIIFINLKKCCYTFLLFLKLLSIIIILKTKGEMSFIINLTQVLVTLQQN